MEAFVQQLVAGLATGGIYAALALALVMIYQSTHLINFAQGDPFWQTNTLNVDSLRKHYDQINMLRVQQRDLPAQQNGAREKKTYAVDSNKYERFFQ